MNNLQAQSHESTAFLTDMYELTMLDAAFKDGTAHRRCTFEVFARKLSDGRRYGVLAGIARVLDAICQFRFTPEQLAENYGALLDEVLRLKPASSKGIYLKKITVSATQGPGVPVDPSVQKNYATK